MLADRRGVLAAFSFAGALAGCSAGSERPKTYSQAGHTVAPEGTVEGDPQRRSQAEAAAEPEPCTPGESRTCHLHFTDSSGQLNCPEATEFCSASGTHWLGCNVPRDDE